MSVSNTFIDGLPSYAATPREAAYSYAVIPPSILRWIELMVRSSRLASAKETSAKSVSFGYHLRTSRLQFSTDPFSYEAYALV